MFEPLALGDKVRITRSAVFSRSAGNEAWLLVAYTQGATLVVVDTLEFDNEQYVRVWHNDLGCASAPLSHRWFEKA